MKILIVTYLYPGQRNQSRKEVSFAVHDFTREWAKEGHSVEVFRLWNYYPFYLKLNRMVKNAHKFKNYEKFIFDGVQVSRIPLYKIPFLPISPKQKKLPLNIVKENKSEFKDIEVVISHMINDSLEISEQISSELNIPLILTIHGSDLKKMVGKKREKYLEIEPNIKKIGFRSNKLMTEYIKMFPFLDSNKNFLVNSGVDKNSIVELNQQLLELKLKNKQILVVGALVEQKKIDNIIRSFAAAQKSNYTLKIIGTGKEKDNLIKLSKKLGVFEKVVFEGQKTKEFVISEMKKSEIFILTSINETLGLVYLEAMSQGCITIGSYNEGIDGIIINNKNGLLCNPKSIDSITNVLKKAMYLNPNEKLEIIKNAIETMEKSTSENVAQLYLENIRKVVRKY